MDIGHPARAVFRDSESKPMKLPHITSLIAAIATTGLVHFAAAQDAKPQPQDKPGYDKAKDVGAAAPEGADIPLSRRVAVLVHGDVVPAAEPGF